MQKADLKSNSTPGYRKPYVCAPIPDGAFPDQIPVVDSLGGFLFMADDDQARELVKQQKVRVWRTSKKHKLRALQAIISLEELQKIVSQRRFFGVPHRRETETNPPRVWTLDNMGRTDVNRDNLMPIDDKRARWCRKVCMEVVNSCRVNLKKAA